MISPFIFFFFFYFFLLSGKREDFGGCFLSLFLNPLFIYFFVVGMVGWVEEGCQWCGAKNRCLITKTLRATELDRGLCLRGEDGFLWRASIFFCFRKKERGAFPRPVDHSFFCLLTISGIVQKRSWDINHFCLSVASIL